MLSMGEGLVHISSMLSAAWCGWVMFGLLVSAVLAEAAQPGIISRAYMSFSTNTNRTYKQSPTTFFGQFFITLFKIGTLAMAVCACVCTGEHCIIAYPGIVSAIALVILLVKMLCNVCIDYTFQLTRQAENPYEQYADVATLCTIVLYASLLFLLRFGTPLAAQWVLGMILLLFVGLWSYRCISLFAFSLRSICYILLYVATLEVLPLVALYVLSEKTIHII